MPDHLQMGTISIIDETERKRHLLQSDLQKRSYIDALNHSHITAMVTPSQGNFFEKYNNSSESQVIFF